MGWWKADPVPDTPTPAVQTSSALPSRPIPPHQLSADAASSSASECPVDPKTREVWLQQAQQQKKNAQSSSRQAELPPSHPTLPISPSKNIASSQECSSDRISHSPSQLPHGRNASYNTPPSLSHAREISSIPRAQLPATSPGGLAAPYSTSPSSSPASLPPANSEAETGTSSSGHWIYPSESQFFHAVMRKQTASSPRELASSISAIIPIHNAVNERAWSLIQGWEGSSSAACGGPKLLSFKGLGAGALSPKARVKSFAGYTEPFDRHDWVVERCGGETVEYVIDFYQGKAPAPGERGSNREGQLNFYLDVRPKLNTLEGCRMRLERFVGWR